jgi:hypothetical protein
MCLEFIFSINPPYVFTKPEPLQVGQVLYLPIDCSKAEIINSEDLIKVGGVHEAREEGLLRTEGKEYVVQDGDVIEIKH